MVSTTSQDESLLARTRPTLPHPTVATYKASPLKISRSAVAISLLLHWAGLAALAAWAPTPLPSPARFAGSDQSIQLTLSFSEPQLTFDELTLENSPEVVPVVIEPLKARVGKRKFVMTPTVDLSADAIFSHLPTQPQPSVEPKANHQEKLERITPEISPPTPSKTKRSPPRKPAPAAIATPPASLGTSDETPPASLGTSDETPPDLSQNVPPVYPTLAQKKGWEGTVLLQIWIDQQGRVTRVEVAKSSGFPLLDGAAANAVRHWRATPGQRNGRPVATQERLPVSFKLRN